MSYLGVDRVAYRRRSSGRYRASARNVGLERALQHIQEAKDLSDELGGTDADVKDYFFTLPRSKLQTVLNAYEAEYGYSRREYAEKAYFEWKNGRRHMSGMVAERLFKLLPHHMPLEKKYKLIENLWIKLGPKSEMTFTVGGDAEVATIMSAVEHHADRVVRDFALPNQLEKRFQWLSSGDSRVKQQLLNRMQAFERQLVISGARERIHVIMNHLRSQNGTYTAAVSQDLIIGNHKIRLEFEQRGQNVIEGSRRSSVRTPDASSADAMDWSWIVIMILIVGFVFVALSN